MFSLPDGFDPAGQHSTDLVLHWDIEATPLETYVKTVNKLWDGDGLGHKHRRHLKSLLRQTHHLSFSLIEQAISNGTDWPASRTSYALWFGT